MRLKYLLIVLPALLIGSTAVTATAAIQEEETNDQMQGDSPYGDSTTPHHIHNPELTEEEDPLRKKVNLDFTDLDLLDVISQLTEKSMPNVISEVIIEGRVTLNARDIPLGEAIELVLRMHDYRIVTDSGLYTITSYKEASDIREQQARGEYPSRFTLFNKHLSEKDDPLRTKVDIDFEGMELSNVLDLLAKKGKIVIETEGVEGNIFMKLNDFPIGWAIQVILRMNQLGLMKDGDVYRVAPRVFPRSLWIPSFLPVEMVDF